METLAEIRKELEAYLERTNEPDRAGVFLLRLIVALEWELNGCERKLDLAPAADDIEGTPV